MHDAEFGVTRLCLFDTYPYRISNPAKFFKEVNGVAAQYSGVDLESQLHNITVTQPTAAFGSSGIPFLDMVANQVLLSQKIGKLLGAGFAKLGLALENPTAGDASLLASIQAVLDKEISVDVIGDLGRYTQYQTVEPISLATQSEGGLAGIDVGLGVGTGIDRAMAGVIFNMMQPNMQQVQQSAQSVTEDPQAKPVRLKSLLDSGLISQEDFGKAKVEALEQLID